MTKKNYKNFCKTFKHNKIFKINCNLPALLPPPLSWPALLVAALPVLGKAPVLFSPWLPCSPVTATSLVKRA